jgi:hypothetical protein
MVRPKIKYKNASKLTTLFFSHIDMVYPMPISSLYQAMAHICKQSNASHRDMGHIKAAANSLQSHGLLGPF